MCSSLGRAFMERQMRPQGLQARHIDVHDGYFITSGAKIPRQRNVQR